MRLLLFAALVGLLSGCTSAHFLPANVGSSAVSRQAEAEPQFRTVAILPIQITEMHVQGLLPIRPDTSAASLRKQQQRCRKLAYQLQAALYGQLQAGQLTTRERYLWLQPAEETNLRLQQAGITYENLAIQSLQQLQQALGTSHLLRGQTTVFRLPVSIRFAAGFLVPGAEKGAVPSALTSTTLALLQGQGGAQLWQQTFQSSGSLPLLSGSSDLAKAIAQPVTQAFPYR